MTGSAARTIRLVLLGALGVVALVPAGAGAQDWPDDGPQCVIAETGMPDVPIPFDEIDEVAVESGAAIRCSVASHGAGGGGVGNESGGGGVGAVGRIDAGAGATAAGSATSLPWMLVAGAGVAGSVLRRRRRS
jgi:hypothetical protein